MDNRETLWINGKLYTPKGVIENGCMRIDSEGRIAAIGGPEMKTSYDGPVRDLQGMKVLPGFIDVHVHGAVGHVMMEGTYESIDNISRFHASHGTTSFLATTQTSTNARIVQALKNANDAINKGVSGAEVLGIHLEGPFLNIIRCGAQDKESIRDPELAELEQFIAASNQQIKLVTIAPEVNGGMEAVKMLTDQGITVSIGHSDASYNEVLEAIGFGASHTTHHFNGMRPFHHRDPGVAGAGLIHPKLTTELICDGFHVHPQVVKFLFESKGPENVCMITDAVDCAGLPDGDYGDKIMKNGEVFLKDGSSLAGSSLTMIKAFRNGLEYTGYSIEKILPSLTEVPARQAGVFDRKGSLEKGKDADFIVLRNDLSLQATYVKGKEVHSID